MASHPATKPRALRKPATGAPLTFSATEARAVATGVAARQLFRQGAFTGPTSGFAPGFVQGNLAVLPRDMAADFLRFCQLNPRPCPLIGMSPKPGDPTIPELGADLDIRTDIPKYRVWRRGELVDEPSDIRSVWREDLVAFVLGCSFSFEEALLENDIELRHQTCGCNVPMYRTNIACAPSGPFQGPMVVSMRPMKPAAAVRAVQITSRFPSVHGAPVHIGLPHLIGIADIARTDYGDAVEVRDDELPVFWACGVTPQAVIATIKPDFCITHAPGSMLISDLKNAQLSVL
ncbi:MAG: putative hydro-lyase [Hyphomicrobiaceae bacterium]